MNLFGRQRASTGGDVGINFDPLSPLTVGLLQVDSARLVGDDDEESCKQRRRVQTVDTVLLAAQAFGRGQHGGYWRVQITWM